MQSEWIDANRADDDDINAVIARLRKSVQPKLAKIYDTGAAKDLLDGFLGDE